MNAKKNDFSNVDDEEWRRLYELNLYEEDARSKGYQYIVGIDEAGRGPLAGPVVAAACFIPKGVYFPFINDSKQLSAEMRSIIFHQITNDSRVHYAVGIADWIEIDRLNIYQATIQAMLRALAQLVQIKVDYLLVDGLKLPHPVIPCLKIIGGDGLSQSIAAASVLAKVTRDRLMKQYHEKWPEYGFDQHKGYGTPQHLEALARHGPCEIHRRSFEPVRSKETPVELSLF